MTQPFVIADRAPTPVQVSIPGCGSPPDLRFAYLNLKDHPRGTLMLKRLIDAGFVPTIVVEEESALADAGRRTQLGELAEVAEFRPAPTSDSLCATHSVVYDVVADHNEPRVGRLLKETGVQLAVLGDTRILKAEVLRSAPYGILNAHPGVLPDVRGNSPYVWAIIHRLPQGVTVHLVDNRVDRGPILLSRRVCLPQGCGLPGLVYVLNELCADMMVEVLHQIIDGNATATPQPDDGRLTFREAHPEIRRLAARLLLAGGARPKAA